MIPAPLQRPARERQRRLHLRRAGLAARQRRGTGLAAHAAAASGAARGEPTATAAWSSTTAPRWWPRASASELAARRARAGAPRRGRAAAEAGAPAVDGRAPVSHLRRVRPDRERGRRLPHLPGAAAGTDGLFAADWTPDDSLADDDGRVRPECVWGALDCPTSAPVANFGDGPADGARAPHRPDRLRRARGRAPRRCSRGRSRWTAASATRHARCSTRAGACCAPRGRSGSSCATPAA